MSVILTDAQGRVKEFRNRAHAFGAKNPFTLATITLVIGVGLGLFFG